MYQDTPVKKHPVIKEALTFGIRVDLASEIDAARGDDGAVDARGPAAFIDEDVQLGGGEKFRGAGELARRQITPRRGEDLLGRTATRLVAVLCIPGRWRE